MNTLKSFAACAAASLLLHGVSRADGSETLGPSSLMIAKGSEVLVAGTGMDNVFIGKIQIDVPTGVQIRQVIAYWEGQALSATEQGNTDTIQLDNLPVTGVRIGGPTNFFFSRWTSTYRADVTALGLVQAGANTVEVRGMDFRGINNGIGLAVIVDDMVNTGDIDVRDGNDNAFINFAAPLDTTNRVDFAFAPSSTARTAGLDHFFGSVATMRPTMIEVRIDDVVTQTIIDALGNHDGKEWDSLSHDVVIPAGATRLSVQVLSADSGIGPYKGLLPASLTWCFASLTMPPASSGGGNEGNTPGFWKNHTWLWDGAYGDDVTHIIKTGTKWNAFFGVTEAESGVDDDATVLDAMRRGGGGLIALNRHAAAGLCNADSPVDYLFNLAQVRALYRDAVGADSGPETILTAHAKFETANEMMSVGFGGRPKYTHR
ncbi:MAG: hypothetical protein KDC95_18215 [Planctomycetes bacterium]|nr:hypothetical protein [Planctomycetota bacterium]